MHRVKGTRLKKGIVRLIKAPTGEILSEDPESLFNEDYRLENEHEHENENENENE